MLLKVENDAARMFYLDECAKSNWSTRQLERQINSFYYQRLLSSQDKDIIRDPYILEFLGLEQTPNLYEKDIEQGLIDYLQKFLLELGRGFSFVSRQPEDNNQIFASKNICKRRSGMSIEFGMPTLIELTGLEENAKLCNSLGF